MQKFTCIYPPTTTNSAMNYFVCILVGQARWTRVTQIASIRKLGYRMQCQWKLNAKTQQVLVIYCRHLAP